MRNFRKMLLLFPLIFCFHSCHEDEELCDTFGKADLALSSMHTLFSEETQFGQIFNIVTDVSNQLYDGVCCEGVGPAGNNTFKGEIYYTSDNEIPDNWGAPIDSDTITQPALGGCQQDQRGIDAEFLQDGIYLIKSIIDATNVVEEHQEDNNEVSTNGRSLNANYSQNNEGSLTIRVTGVGKSKVTDEKGKVIIGRIISMH